jgi:ribosomal protein L7Ae-like RNA K-turn-binding protein
MTNSSQKSLGLLGLAHRAGKIAMGRQAVLEALNTGRARLLMFTADAPEKLVEPFTEKAESLCPVVHMNATRSDLGIQLGRRDVVVVAILESSFAQGILSYCRKKDNSSGRRSRKSSNGNPKP